MPYVIRTRDLDYDCTHTWQRAKAPQRMGNSFAPFTTAHSVYPTLKGAQRQRDFLKRITRYAFCHITVEKLT
jgi:hypothetical protein